MKKKQPIDIGTIVGAVIFIALFVGLVLLGIYGESGSTYETGFFEDVGNVMQARE